MRDTMQRHVARPCNALSRSTLEYLCPFFGSVEDASWSTDLAPASKYYSPETPMCELIEKII